DPVRTRDRARFRRHHDRARRQHRHARAVRGAGHLVAVRQPPGQRAPQRRAGPAHRAPRRPRRASGRGRGGAIAAPVRPRPGRGGAGLALALASAHNRRRGLAVSGTMDTVRILLVEDDAPTRRRLHDALAANAGFEVVSVDTVAGARESLAGRVPDVLVTDLELPDGHGAALTAGVHLKHRKVEILVISVLCDERNVVAAISAGASGYIVKDALPEDIGETVRQVLQGHSPLSAAIARYIL